MTPEREAARMASAIDVIVLTTDVEQYQRTSEWVVSAVGRDGPVVVTRTWGVLLERRMRLPDGLEVEFGFAPPSWAATEPLDDGTARVVGDGFVALHDPYALRRLPVGDGCVDGIWSSASLLHVPRADVPATLRGWWSALCAGGVLALSTAVKDADDEGWEEVPYATERRRWFVYHSPGRLVRMVESAGFEVCDTETQEGARRWLHVVATAGQRPG